MQSLRVPELGLYRGWSGKSRAARLILSQLGAGGLYLSPRALAIVATACVAFQLIPLTMHSLALWQVAVFSSACWAVLISTITVSTVHKARAALRRDLIRQGLPVCLECGYDLRGAPSSALRCAECGADTQSLSERAWEPIPEMVIYPELSRCASTAEARMTLETAQRRSGALFRHRRASLVGALILLTVLRIVLFSVAETLAYQARQDLSYEMRFSLLSAAVVSFPLTVAGGYALVVRRVRREIARGGPASESTTSAN